MWRIRYDDSRIGEEDLELSEVIEALELYDKNMTAPHPAFSTSATAAGAAVIAASSGSVCVCVCVRERERVCVCVCARARSRYNQGVLRRLKTAVLEDALRYVAQDISDRLKMPEDMSIRLKTSDILKMPEDMSIRLKMS